MPIRTFELFHGCVLAKIIRSDRPTSLRLIETNPQEHWSTYVINDVFEIFIKYRKQSKPARHQGRDGTSWSFIFNETQLRQLKSRSNKPVYLALVCAREKLGSDKSNLNSEICLIEPKKINDLFSFNNKSQSLTVWSPSSGSQLRVYKNKTEQFKVARSKLDKLELPG